MRVLQFASPLFSRSFLCSFQSAPRELTRGDWGNARLAAAPTAFQSAPRELTRSDSCLRLPRAWKTRFNPRPANAAPDFLSPRLQRPFAECVEGSIDAKCRQL